MMDATRFLTPCEATIWHDTLARVLTIEPERHGLPLHRIAIARTAAKLLAKHSIVTQKGDLDAAPEN
jgi:hypothetical protein